PPAAERVRHLLALGILLAAGALPQPAPVAARSAPLAGTAQVGKPQTGLDVIALTIETSGGRRHGYKVELARSADQQARGMMFRTKVPRGTGMLFPFSPPRPAGFWMENTFVSLDLLFIGSDGRIRNIAADTVPMSRAQLQSVGPVAAVLELAGGEAARIGAKPGDKVSWKTDR
ncbi:MAG: DUF192 domain-containing protein, partial [Sandaracinobacteroides sp.]